MNGLFAGLLAIGLGLGVTAWADTDSSTPSTPSPETILTVSGMVDGNDAIDVLKLDRAMLMKMKQTEFGTTTIWTNGVQKFRGVPLLHLLNETMVNGERIVAYAINDYSIEIPLTDISEEAPIIAYERNGKPMSVRDKGPLWIVYPYDSSPKYRTETIYTRSIWQLDRIEVVN